MDWKSFISRRGRICRAAVALSLVCTGIVGGLTRPSPALASYSSALYFSYMGATVSQTASFSIDADVSELRAQTIVSRYNRPGKDSTDLFYFEVVYRAGSTVVATRRHPTSGNQNLTSGGGLWNPYSTYTLSLARADVANFDSINSVSVTLFGDDGEFWNGNYGPRVVEASVKKVTSGGSTEILTNPNFTSTSGWTSSAGWGTCSGSSASRPCVANGDFLNHDGAATTTTTTTTTTTSTTTTTTIPADTTAPMLSSRTPTDNATGVSRTANLVMNFSENVSAVAGKFVTVMDGTSNSAVETISVTNTSLVTVSGSTVTVNPATTLDYGSDYFVRVDAGAFRDTAGNAFAGIWDSTAWNFVTAQAPDSTAPTLTSSAPADGATGVSRTADLVFTFSENVSAVSGKDITVLKFTDSSVVETIAANDSSQVTISGNRVTVNRSVTLGYSTVYFVRIDTGAFRDTAGNGYAGLWTNTELNFTTESGPVSTTTTVPGSSTTIGSQQTGSTVGNNSSAGANDAITSNSASPSGGSETTVPVVNGNQTASTVAALGSGLATTTTTRSNASGGEATSTTAGSTTTTTTPAEPERVGAFTDPQTGQMVAYLNGSPVEIETSTVGSSAVASVGQVSMTITVERSNGEPALPNPDGSLPVREGDTVRVNVTGLTPESDAEIWVFSDPTLLGRPAADGVGSLKFESQVPEIEPGDHHVVLEGRSRDDADVSLGMKLLALESTGTSVVQRVGTALVWTLLIVGVLAGLFLPTTLRRRREEN